MAKKIRRVIGAIFLISGILLTQIPVTQMSAANGTNDFQMNQNTLVKYTGTASSVSISDTVKIIGEEAFAENLGLNVVSSGKNIKSISYAAFANCTYLSKIDISDSVEEIGNSVFSGCENLTKINFGKNLKKVGNGVFAGCNSLETITIDKDNPYFVVDDGALYDKDKTTLYAYLNGNDATSYKMPNTVEKIKEYAFWGNQTLENISLSGSLKEIPGYAFANCKNLQEIAIPYSVRSIDAKAFENCLSLKDTNIPSSVLYVDSTAFAGCHKLNIIADEGSAAYAFFQTFDKSTITTAEEDDTKEIVVSSKGSALSESDTDHEKATDNNKTSSNLKDASSDPSNVEYMPKSDPLAGLEDSAVIAKTIVVNGNAVLFLNKDNVSVHQGMIVQDDETDENTKDLENSQTIYDPQKGGYLPKYTIVGHSIANQAFYANDMDSYRFTDNIEDIGDFSFARSNIASIDIPDSVKNIGYGAFYHCNSLREVTIPNSVETIEANVFDKTPWLTNWKSNQDGNDFLVVGNHILLAYKGNSSNIEIPPGVVKIAPGCFESHTEIESIYLPDSLKEIAEDAFNGCERLETITGGNHIDTIGDRAFLECPISTVIIPSTVKNMGLGAIDFSNTLKENNTKVVVFQGNEIPKISYGTASQRLSNTSLRKDVLYNTIFAVVNDSCDNFKDTVLDSEKLGFSGIIVSIEKDKDGNETGNVIAKKNNIFSENVMSRLPKSIVIRGKEYQIKDFEQIELAKQNTAETNKQQTEVLVLYNQEESDQITASFSETEDIGYLSITESEEASQQIKDAYVELFGQELTMKAFDIELMDTTNTLPITRFGQATLSITMPIPDDISGETYHVICLDEDGQLEEVDTNLNKDDNLITFKASHLSYYAIYATGRDTVTLDIHNGELVKNYRKDESPNTGDYSVPPQYVLAIGFISLSLLFFFWKGKQKNVTV